MAIDGVAVPPRHHVCDPSCRSVTLILDNTYSCTCLLRIACVLDRLVGLIVLFRRTRSDSGSAPLARPPHPPCVKSIPLYDHPSDMTSCCRLEVCTYSSDRQTAQSVVGSQASAHTEAGLRGGGGSAAGARSGADELRRDSGARRRLPGRSRRLSSRRRGRGLATRLAVAAAGGREDGEGQKTCQPG